VLTKDAKATTEFYSDMLGFEAGPRPNFKFPGAWLYNEGKAILHLVEKQEIPAGAGVLDHMAFWATDLPHYLAKLKARNIPYEIRRVPQGVEGAGTWQLFFFDPNGAKVELDLPSTESAPGHE